MTREEGGASAAQPPDGVSLPRQLTGLRAPIVWGVVFLIVIEGTVLALFVVSAFYLRLSSTDWPPPGTPSPDLLSPTVGQLLLLSSPLPLALTLRGLVRDRRRPALLAIPGGMILAGSYVALKVREYAGKDYSWNSHAYGSLDWTMTGYASLHVGVLLVAAGFVWLLLWLGHFGGERYTGMQALLIYWLFVAAGSLLFYGTQYLAPHFIGGGGLLGPLG